MRHGPDAVADHRPPEVYHENLKPSCNTATVSYDDRVTKREEEIESLKEALQILDSPRAFAPMQHALGQSRRVQRGNPKHP